MRRAVAVFVLSAILAGCENRPDWLRWGSSKPEPPVSVPTTAAPATQPAAPPATQPVVAPAPVPVAPTTAPAPAPAPKPVAKPLPAPVPEPMPTTPKPAAKPAPAIAPLPSATGGSVMAYVNDKPIYMATLTDLLIAGHGLTLAQQLIANELVRQEAARQKVTITQADLDAEHDRTLRGMFENVDDANQRQRLLKQLLTRNRVSEGQWDLTMRRNALLRKLAEKQVVVTDEDVRDEFGRQYERKVEVQHIQTASLANAQKVLRELASGEDFSALVAKYSLGPSAKNAGLLAPFGAKDTGTPPAIREAALAMRKIGEVSDPIQIGTAFHVIKLVRIIEPKDVKLEDVKDKLATAVKARKVQALQQDILQILLRGARIRYVNPVLKAQADEGT